MKTNRVIQNGTVDPSAFITKGKQRLKQHNNTVYLNNGDEFEIEFYNPTQLKVLAKIELNGKSIGSGIIIRPGQRVYLERYIDDAKKFLFDTYNVKGDNEEVKNAIKNNGDVKVKFFSETINLALPITTNYYPWSQHLTNPYPFTLTTNSNFYSTTTGGVSDTTLSHTSGDFTTNLVTTSYAGPNNMNKLRSKSIETGSVEKGSDSKQTFTYDTSTFNMFSSWSNEWKILPTSQKPIYSEDIKTFCGECGNKKKKDSFKFCPNCGTKY